MECEKHIIITQEEYNNLRAKIIDLEDKVLHGRILITLNFNDESIKVQATNRDNKLIFDQEVLSQIKRFIAEISSKSFKKGLLRGKQQITKPLKLKMYYEIRKKAISKLHEKFKNMKFVEAFNFAKKHGDIEYVDENFIKIEPLTKDEFVEWLEYNNFEKTNEENIWLHPNKIDQVEIVGDKYVISHFNDDVYYLKYRLKKRVYKFENYVKAFFDKTYKEY